MENELKLSEERQQLFNFMLSELEHIADHSVNIAYSMSDEDEDEILAAENEALTAKN